MTRRKKKEDKIGNCITCQGDLTLPYYKVDNVHFPEGYVKICADCRNNKCKTPKEFIHKVEE